MTQSEMNSTDSNHNSSGNPEERPFYIGWMAAAPKALVQFIKKYLLFIFILVVVLGSLLAISQKKFGTGNFEFGTLTDVKGIYFDKPVPCLKVLNGKDIWGNQSYITIPLVGYGKHGAEGAIRELEKEKNTVMNQKEVTLRGTLLYNDGVTILQVDKNDNANLKISGEAIPVELLPKVKDLGNSKIKGEIIDPKCYFGVMKPGEGKPHRDCAIRCILGGISPMLAVKNEKGEANYYLLASSDGESINTVVQDYVAEAVELEVRLMQYDDWVVAYLSTKDPIKRYSYLQENFSASLQFCAVNMMK
jgi:hypothetical protein